MAQQKNFFVTPLDHIWLSLSSPRFPRLGILVPVKPLYSVLAKVDNPNIRDTILLRNRGGTSSPVRRFATGPDLSMVSAIEPGRKYEKQACLIADYGRRAGRRYGRESRVRGDVHADGFYPRRHEPDGQGDCRRGYFGSNDRCRRLQYRHLLW